VACVLPGLSGMPLVTESPCSTRSCLWRHGSKKGVLSIEQRVEGVPRSSFPVGLQLVCVGTAICDDVKGM
jgi:hypothetical protein